MTAGFHKEYLHNTPFKAFHPLGVFASFQSAAEPQSVLVRADRVKLGQKAEAGDPWSLSQRVADERRRLKKTFWCSRQH